MAFINRQFLIRNNFKSIAAKKIKLKKNDISLSYMLSRVSPQGYKIVFIVNINQKNIKTPETRLSPFNVDMVSLRNAIMANIKLYDRKYIILKSFDTYRANFIFDAQKWLDEALKNVKPLTKFSAFSREFKFSKRLPFMILIDPMQSQFEKFILKEFLNYMEKKRKQIEWFKYLFPYNVRAKLRDKIRGMFDWSYDFSWNRVIATMKSLYILGIIAAVGILGKRKINKTDLKTREFMFSSQVQKNLKKFNLKKFSEIISKRNLF